MRLWSLHPNQLDSRGLVAAWREALLALAVVSGRTRGYRHHPQLLRFTERRTPARLVRTYLFAIYREAEARGFAFDRTKLGTGLSRARMTVTRGQLEYEWRHLLDKLHRRDRMRWMRQRQAKPLAHPMFTVVPGPIAVWERVR